nr:hypothetical protein [uncultured Arsenicibacter sp.]
MKLRWRYWLLPILMMGMFISIFEVNTVGIINSWGDDWDTYLPAEYTRDQFTSATTSPSQVLSAQVLNTSLRRATLHFGSASTSVPSRYRWLWQHRIFLRCCQWRI